MMRYSGVLITARLSPYVRRELPCHIVLMLAPISGIYIQPKTSTGRCRSRPEAMKQLASDEALFPIAGRLFPQMDTGSGLYYRLLMQDMFTVQELQCPYPAILVMKAGRGHKNSDFLGPRQK
jgi:hypothetical protein